MTKYNYFTSIVDHKKQIVQHIINWTCSKSPQLCSDTWCNTLSRLGTPSNVQPGVQNHTHTRSLSPPPQTVRRPRHKKGYCSGALTCFPNRCAEIVQQILHGALLARFADRLNEFLQIGAVLPGEWSSAHKCASELELARWWRVHCYHWSIHSDCVCIVCLLCRVELRRP